jgi:hypothetical protein
VLLAAATTALHAPQGSGTYWYVRTDYTKGSPSSPGAPYSVETWVRRDGMSWVRLGSTTGHAVSNQGDHGHWTDGFDVGERRLTLTQIQNLPTEPAALKAWLIKNERDTSAKYAGVRLMGDVIGLLSGVPAPPKVRAAAFQVLAGLPGIKSLGPVKDGQAVLIPDPEGRTAVAVNLTTSKVSSLTNDVINGHKVTGSENVVAAGWTNTLP